MLIMPFRFFNSAPEMFSLVAVMNVRFPLSLWNIEHLLFERGSTCARKQWERGGSGSGRCSPATSEGSGCYQMLCVGNVGQSGMAAYEISRVESCRSGTFTFALATHQLMPFRSNR